MSKSVKTGDEIMRKYLIVALVMVLGLLLNLFMATSLMDNMYALVEPLIQNGLTLAIEDPHPWVSV